MIERDETVTTLRATGVRALPLDAPSLPSLPRWRSHMSMPSPRDNSVTVSVIW
ncbi:MAG: hypothetical protein J4G18_14850 [Anaerolineae bacterium]|nr:hypothetical protein [Anaerolineae bacterium]